MINQLVDYLACFVECAFVLVVVSTNMLVYFVPT